MTAGYRPTCRCPDCGRIPTISFSEEEVRRNKLERANAHVQRVKCQRCHGLFWIMAKHIASAVPLLNGRLKELLDPLTVEALKKADLLDEARLREMIEDKKLGAVKGIGPRRESEIIKALDHGR